MPNGRRRQERSGRRGQEGAGRQERSALLAEQRLESVKMLGNLEKFGKFENRCQSSSARPGGLAGPRGQ